MDDYSLALQLKGVCLRQKQQHFQAEQCFKEVIEKWVWASQKYKDQYIVGKKK